MSFSDTQLTCRDCSQPFVWTAGEQEFYQQRGLTNAPVRCKSCRQARRANSDGGSGGGGYNSGGERQMFEATCSGCGGAARVPFQPRGDKPVYCSNCFAQQRGSGGGGRY